MVLSTQSASAKASLTRPWPAEQVELWPIERLIPYANNPRLHSAVDIKRIAASILKWGWTNPVLADEHGVLIAGHCRVAAGAMSGLTVPIPVIVAHGWSEEEKQAYRLADNELAARASWDRDLLRNELHDLKFSGFDLELIGFEPDRLEDILAGLGSSGLTDPDSTPETSENPVTQTGDVWLLGDHRIGCGDSTSAADVEPVLAGSRPDLMVTDPPYGIDYDPSWRAQCSRDTDRLARGKVLNDDRADWRQAYALFTGDVAYVWHAALLGDVAAVGLATCGFQLRAQIVWAKQHFALSRGDYHWKHECCWYAVARARPATGKATARRAQSGRSPMAIHSAIDSANRAGATARKSRSSALARSGGAGPPGSGQRPRQTVTSRPLATRQRPRPRADAGAARRTAQTLAA